ncbi:MAG: hypothetical protein BroJett022_22480 [Actinomycetes bacterium]|nr:MAG: hypothetical protein BroJett022_22480 [Actinomycetes bacterium]
MPAIAATAAAGADCARIRAGIGPSGEGKDAIAGQADGRGRAHGKRAVPVSAVAVTTHAIGSAEVSGAEEMR